ncbi:SDR family NAD(P)-dependent oxidoreductase [Nocardioides sp. TF02-7]|uniref:SDR family NAD(P)-dependent oxidoreductase n=1 Tax=Nocardioides sp. TF02-7 TaxID=2917724 RepID=UPI001F0619B4|nr:SDR family NAD(P)-dependent oxidoreductase [Nocardioides sp. TF02-7]UMG94408.1 SDR family oxidoreductase [Nocardioides sp. TF02-7]
MTMRRFEGRTVIVTGGARGMGASHVRGFADEGASLVVADVLEDEGRRLADEIGERALYQHLDVTEEDQWAATVENAERAFGPVSVLVNNAGVLAPGVIEHTPPDTWRRVLDVNLTGQFLGIRAVVPSMRRAEGGSIVNVSSVTGLKGVAGIGAYVASKWGLRGLTRTAALELSRDGIRVNSVHPGSVRTPMTEPDRSESSLLADDDSNPVTRLDISRMVEQLAIPRKAEPEEITRQVLFLASDEASFSTGAEFVADGGDLLGPVA